jgi:hypothetical protein
MKNDLIREQTNKESRDFRGDFRGDFGGAHVGVFPGDHNLSEVFRWGKPSKGSLWLYTPSSRGS